MPRSHEIQLKGRHGFHRISEMDSSGYFVFIPAEHHEIHEGNYFILDNIQSNVNIASPKEWLLITPNNETRIHLSIQGTTSNSGTFAMYEGPTVTSNGSTLVPVNLDRNSSKVAELEFYLDPTVTDDGTFVMGVFLGSASPKPAPIGGAATRENEMILKKNTKYLIRFSPDTDGTVVSISFTWHEVQYPD